MSKAARTRSARERLAEQRAREAARQKRNRAAAITAAAVVILAVVLGVGVYLINKKDKRTQLASAYTGQLAPLSRESDGSIVMAKAGVTAPLLEVFEDFQCPICKEFESTSGDTVKKLAAEGKVKVVYRPFQLFQQDPEAANSKHAANAALCAPADKWISYHDALYKYQPAEGSKGFSNTNLKLWAKDLGFETPAFDKCVDDMQKSSQLASITSYTEKQRGGQRHPDGLPQRQVAGPVQPADEPLGSGEGRHRGRRHGGPVPVGLRVGVDLGQPVGVGLAVGLPDEVAVLL